MTPLLLISAALVLVVLVSVRVGIAIGRAGARQTETRGRMLFP